MRFTTLLVCFILIYLFTFNICIMIKISYKLCDDKIKFSKYEYIKTTLNVSILLIIFPIYAFIRIKKEKLKLKRILLSILVLLPELIDLSIDEILERKSKVYTNCNRRKIYPLKTHLGLSLIFKKFKSTEYEQIFSS